MAKKAILFADSARGVYIPQHFAESHSADHWQGMDSADLEILKSGPDHEFYFDSWRRVLDNAETIDGGRLHQDGDLWVYWPQDTIDALQEYIDSQVEYAESHVDAGAGYDHLPRESWCETDQDQLEKELDQRGIDRKGLDSDRIADLALDNFSMVSGNIWLGSIDSRFIVLQSYAVQEVEIQIEPESIGIDQLTFDLIKESRDFCINGDCAYVSTNAVWYAVIDQTELQTLINEESAK